jgi:ubiquinone/menaquinone biosynthesis C-methylase UbiE
VVAAVLYWIVVVSEGTYLGPKVVIWLYDRTAGSYDGIKDIPPGWDQERIAEPLVARLAGRADRALVLDVATGTARMPMALLAEPAFGGQIVGTDLSRSMLRRAWRKVGGWSPRVALLRAPAVPLPFADEQFDVVAMLEALEFTPQPRATLAELVRVLAPGGTALVTNRVGWEARLLPRRAFSGAEFAALLAELGLESVAKERWQTHYDLYWAVKPGLAQPRTGPWTSALRCSGCARTLSEARSSDNLTCPRCGLSWTWRDGAWEARGRAVA